MTYILNQEQVSELTAFRNAGQYDQMYEAIFGLLENPDANGNDLDDRDVQVWFEAATSANRGEGAASALIRDYTIAQIEQRLGDDAFAGKDPQAIMQDASNAIAESIFLNHIRDGQVPTIVQIRERDATEVVRVLREEGFDVGFEIWSGNVLFPGLGDTVPYFESVLTQGPEGTYDLVTAMGALGSNSIATFASNLLQSAGDVALNFGSVNQVLDATVTYLDDVYGEWRGDLFSLLSTSTGGAKVQVGLQGDVDETIDVGARTDNDVIHAAGGNDLVIGGNGTDLIDGGTDIDLVSFERETSSSSDVSIILTTYGDFVPSGFSGVVDFEGSADQTTLFNIEEVTLGTGSDTFKLEGIQNLRSIDASINQLGDGDTIDASAHFSALSFDLASENIGFQDGTSLTALNFENVVGTNYDDRIRGNEDANTIDGGDGIDVLDFSDAESGVTFKLGFPELPQGAPATPSGIAGEAAGDVYISIEAAVGSNFADTFLPSHPGAIFAGGGGADVFELPANGGGPSIVWGGAGADTYKFDPSSVNPAGILVATIDNLTEDNFHLFSLEDLNLGSDFNFYEIEAVILNPDASDRVVIENCYGTEDVLGLATATAAAYSSLSTVVVDTVEYSSTLASATNQAEHPLVSGYSSGAYLGDYQVDFLSKSGGSTVGVTAAAARFSIVEQRITELPDGKRYIYTEDGRTDNIASYLNTSSADFSKHTVDHPLFFDDVLSMTEYFWKTYQVEQNGEQLGNWPGPSDEYSYGFAHAEDIPSFTDPRDIGDWFIYGAGLGGASGSSLVIDSATAVKGSIDETRGQVGSSDNNSGGNGGGSNGGSGAGGVSATDIEPTTSTGSSSNVQQLEGTTGNDRFSDTDGRNAMIGGAGSDIFVMLADGQKDDVLDFTIGEDVLDLSAWGVGSFADLFIRQDGAHSKLHFEDEILELSNIVASNLRDADFLFAEAPQAPQAPSTPDSNLINDTDGRSLLSGKDGQSDIFVMLRDGDREEITKFTLEEDKIDISSWGLTGIDDPRLNIRHDGSSTKINFDGWEEYIEVKGVLFDLTDADSFVFAKTSQTPEVRQPNLIEDTVGRSFLSGADGEADTFVMLRDGDREEITNFALGEDKIDVSSWGLTGIDDPRLNIRHDGQSTKINFDGWEEYIEIKSVLFDPLDADNFLF